MTYDAASDGVVYLDYNATAPVRSEAVEATLSALGTVANASSVHQAGRDAAMRVEHARKQVADLLGCSAGEIIFTSGATEANNLALRAAYARGGTLITTAVEHPAVVEVARDLTSGRAGSLVVLPVDGDGTIDLPALAAACARGGVALVSVMLANNETGVLSDLGSVTSIAHEAGALVHTDATQYVGRLPLHLDVLDVDLLSLSGHKFGAPQGVGALFLRRGVPVPQCPVLIGGGQERGWRAGTLNVPGIVGLGAAAEVARSNCEEEATRVAKLRDFLETELTALQPGCWINGAAVDRLPGVCSVTFPGLPADAVLSAMPDIAASDGSACAAGAPSPSHVLLAMGLSRDHADSTIRLSLGYATTEHDIRTAVTAVDRAVTEVRMAMGVP